MSVSKQRSPWRGLTALAINLAILALLLTPAIPNLQAIYARRENWQAFVPQQPVWTIFTLLPWSWASVIIIAGTVAGRWINAALAGRPKMGRESLAADDLPNGSEFYRQRLPTPPAPTLLVVIWLLVPVSLAWLATATDAARLFFPRYVVAAAPAAFVLVAFSVRLIPWHYVQIPAALALLAYAIHSSQIVQQLRYDGQIIGDRQEDWRSAVAWLNEQLPDNRYPILLRSGLIEAGELRTSERSGTARILPVPADVALPGLR